MAGSRASKTPVKRRKVKVKATRTVEVSANEERATELRGITLRKLKRKDWIVIDVQNAPPEWGRNVGDMETMAARFGLKPEEVLSAILDQKLNVKAMMILYGLIEGEVNAPVDNVWPKRPTAAKARQLLKKRAFKWEEKSNNDLQNYKQWEEHDYLDWSMFVGTVTPTKYAMPLSKKFQKVLDDAAAERARQLKARSLQQPFKELEALFLPIQQDISLLVWHITTVAAIGQDTMQELGLLEALEGMLEVIRKHPKKEISAAQLKELRKVWPHISDVNRDDLEWCGELLVRLRKLKGLCYQHMVVEPATGHVKKVAADRLQKAKDLLAKLEDPAFVRGVDLVTKNPEFVPYRLWKDLCELLRQAGIALLQSPMSEKFLTSHIEPMIARIAARPLDTTGLSARNIPGFDAELVKSAPLGPPTSVFDKLVNAANVTNLLVGNLPGPASVAVLLADRAIPHLLARAGRSLISGNGAISARLFRFSVNVSGLSQYDRLMIIRAIDANDMTHVKDVKWDKAFQNSPAWGAALGLINGIALVAAVRDDEANTLARVSSIISTSAGTALGAATMVAPSFERFRVLLDTEIKRVPLAGWLGGVAGLAGALSSFATAYDKFQDDDSFHGVLSIASGVGSVASVAGFFLGAGLFTASTGALAPLGAVLEAIGLAIVLGAALVDFISGLLTNATEKLFEGFVDHFGKSVTFKNTREAVKAVDSAWSDLRSKLNEWFEDIPYAEASSKVVGILIDLGFSDRHIAAIVDKERHWVHQNLDGRELAYT